MSSNSNSDNSDHPFPENIEEEEEEEYYSGDDSNDAEFKPETTTKSDDEATVEDDDDDDDVDDEESDGTYSVEPIINMKMVNGEVEVLFKTKNGKKSMPLSKARIEKTQDVIAYFESHIYIPTD